MFRLRVSLFLCCWWSWLVQGHTVITYPGWRGNNLIVNDTFPFGMQWMYPCGGLGVSRNRTAWPITGGALAVQPGWFRGHSSNLMHVNIGFGAEPANYSTILVPRFLLTGPSDNPYPGTFCLPQIPLPGGFKPKSGDLASIQLVQTQQHGGTLYNCADIIFTDDLSTVPEVGVQNCFNSSDLRISSVNCVAAQGASTGGNNTPPTSRTDLFGSQVTGPPAQADPKPNGAARRALSKLSGFASFWLLL